MNRRTFLQTLPAIPAFGMPFLNLAAAPLPPPSDKIESTTESTIAPLNDSYGEAIVRAAIFPSVLWGPADNPEFYERVWLPHRRRQFPNESLEKIQNGRLVGNGLPTPDLVIALAHPDDVLSWNAALQQCRLAKAHDALTLLVAAREYPRYPSDPGMQIARVNKPSSNGAGLVLNISTMNVYADLANILDLFVKSIKSSLVAVDFADIRTVLGNADEGFLFAGDGQGTNRAQVAASSMCQQINSHPALQKQTRGTFVIMEVDSRFEWREMSDVIDELAAWLPDQACILLSCCHWHCVDSRFKVSAIVTI